MAKRSYPSVDLGKTVDLARTMYKNEGFNWAAPSVVIEHLGYSPTGSTGLRALAALLHFGLAEEKGSGNDRRVRLSEIGKTIVLDSRPDSRERQEALREAALTPTLYSEIWGNFGPNLPSDRNLEYHLVREMDFNHNSVRSFLRDLRTTFELAGVGDDELSFGEDTDVDEPDTKVASGPSQPKGGSTMPQINADPTSMQVVPLPLFDGRFATLNIPKPLSASDYRHLRNLLITMYDGMEKLLVGDVPTGAAKGDLFNSEGSE